MSTELGLALINLVQVLALAYIGLRQAEVKRELDRTNGHVAAELASIRQSLTDQPGD